MIHWDKEVDAIVVGAGGAGLAAAIELAEFRNSILVFEKQATLEETSTALCEGAFCFSGTSIQKSLGIHDSNELLYQDLMKVGNYKNREYLVRTFVQNQAETFSWLNRLGVEWTNVESGAGMSVARAHITHPGKLLDILKNYLHSKGVNINFNTRVIKLIRNNKSCVTGAVTFGKQGRKKIRARKGIILATGGFGRDRQRLAAIDQRLLQVEPVVGTGHNGDGHRMAEELGGYLIDLEYLKPTFGISATLPLPSTFSVMFYNGAIIINQKGKRFIDESSSYKEIGKAALDQPKGIGYQIFDYKLYKVGIKKATNVEPDKAMFGLDPQRIDLLYKGNTIQELAVKMEVPSETLFETICTYNQHVDHGEDLIFGRKSLAGHTGNLVKIDTPPFFSYPSKGMLPGTYGGIDVYPDMRVRNRKGAIDGLYAAGEIVGGFHGVSYMTGTAVSKALIFGRVAGRTLAKND